jgi:hypothetical protein
VRPGIWPGVGDRRTGRVGQCRAGQAGDPPATTGRRRAGRAGMRRGPPSSYRSAQVLRAVPGQGSSQVRTDVGPSTVRGLARGGQTATGHAGREHPHLANRPSSRRTARYRPRHADEPPGHGRLRAARPVDNYLTRLPQPRLRSLSTG